MMVSTVREIDGGLQFMVKVQPRASRNEVSGWQGDLLKVRLTAPPVDGEANEACVRFLAEWLKVAPYRVRIMSGHTSTKKMIRVEGLGLCDMPEVRRLS